MGLFRRKGPVVFEPRGYTGSRSRWRVPRWLVILLAGVALGAGGLWLVQERYGPKRLSPQEARELQERVVQLDGERGKLQADLDASTTQLQGTRAENRTLAAELAAVRQTAERQQKDLALFDHVLPPDPRGGPIGVRAARFDPDPSQLLYHVLLTSERPGSKPFKGVMDFVVLGARATGREESITLTAVPVGFDAYQHVQGRSALPAGFVPRQITVRVLDAPGGRVLAMRVYNVR